MSEQLKILVVDDDDDIRELCKMLLIQEGYLAHTAADYQEAIKCLASCKFDLLITDIQMPGKAAMISSGRYKSRIPTSQR